MPVLEMASVGESRGHKRPASQSVGLERPEGKHDKESRSQPQDIEHAAVSDPSLPVGEPSTTTTNVNTNKKRITAKGKKPPPMSKKERQEPNSVPPEYYFENGLRKVRPYSYIYQTYAKQRWLGMTIYRVFEKEFHDRPSLYYKRAIEQGKITVNGAQVSPTYIVQNSDLIENSVHRHEPPVSDEAIEIVHRSETMLVISKPSSIPVHPTGRYRHNTVLHILLYEHGIKNMFPINRIDRLTSGLLLIALDKTTAAQMMTEMRERQITKVYLARVKGEFPLGDIECTVPIEVAQFKVGINLASENGRECATTFRRVWTNGVTSVVECRPKTGRTHQIRVHLQYLGHPIANDPIYCTDAWGEQMGKGGLSASERDAVLMRVSTSAFASEDAVLDVTDADGNASTANGSVSIADGCAECRLVRRDPTPEQLSIWLHAWCYEAVATDGWRFDTPAPAWAAEGRAGDEILAERFWAHGGRWDGVAPGEFAKE